jgi:[protein-PII] uridylyltransferase
MLEGDGSAAGLLAAKSEAADGLVTTACEEFLAGEIKRIAICAAGGYGRRELFPFSDVDLVLLFEAEADIAGAKEAISRFMSALWDRGLRASHSVRTLAECTELHEHNIELHISLLDVRFVHGQKSLFDALTDRLAIFNRRYGMVLTKYLAEMTRRRHAKFNNTIYHLEPDIKETPGCIRDIHVLRWLAQLAPEHRIDDSAGRLKSETAFLFRLRCFLHLLAGRDKNLLSYEMQDEAARFLP